MKRRGGDTEREEKDADHRIRAPVKETWKRLYNDQKYPKQMPPSSLQHTKRQQKGSEKHIQIKDPTQSFQYARNNVAQPECINHLLKKYLLFYCMNRLKESPRQCPLTRFHANSARLVSFPRTLTCLLTAPGMMRIPMTVS